MAELLPPTPPTCWWCGDLADSREHKFTAFELRLANGSGPWAGEAAVLHGDFSEKLSPIQGPNSTLMKFSPSMCANCNNARSQPFDRAYQHLLAYVVQNEATVGSSGFFRFSDVYGADWRLGRANLLKYWVKHACCRAVEAGLTIPDAVRNHLDDPAGMDDPPHFLFSLSVQQDMLNLRLSGEMPWGSFFGDAEVYNNENGELAVIKSHYSWGWFRYYYVLNVDEPFSWTDLPGDGVQMAFESIPGGWPLDKQDWSVSRRSLSLWAGSQSQGRFRPPVRMVDQLKRTLLAGRRHRRWPSLESSLVRFLAFHPAPYRAY